jgi:hypothetical protein
MATLSGQNTIAAAGTAEQLAAAQQVNAPVMVKALTTNTGLIYIGNVAADVDSTNGMPLAAGDACIFNHVGNLQDIWVDSAVNGEGVAWLVLDL